MSARDGRHDRTVDDPQPGHPVDRQLRADHRVPVAFRSHFARARLVMHLHRQPLHATRPVRVRAVFQVPAAGHGPRAQRRPEFLKRGRFVQLNHHFDGFDDAGQVLGVVEKVGPDHGFRIRIGVSQSDLRH